MLIALTDSQTGCAALCLAIALRSNRAFEG